MRHIAMFYRLPRLMGGLGVEQAFGGCNMKLDKQEKLLNRKVCVVS